MTREEATDQLIRRVTDLCNPYLEAYGIRATVILRADDVAAVGSTEAPIQLVATLESALAIANLRIQKSDGSN